MRQQWADYRVFWREFRQAYHTTGAVLPSGPALAAALSRYVRDDGEAASAAGTNGAAASSVDRESGRRILEVGPGTGAVTGEIIRQMRPEDRLVLVERSKQFVARLRGRLANELRSAESADRITLLHAGVEDLPDDDRYDLIVSGLPLNNFAVELVETILAKLRHLLAPGGTLSFFEYVAIRRAKSLVSSRNERQRLRGVERVLSEVLQENELRRDLVLANVPPAWVHHVRFGG